MESVRRVSRLVLGVLLISLHAHGARAEIRVQGAIEAVRLQADDASVEDVLAALHARFGLLYRSPSVLTRHITATFEGPLSRVLPRVLEGYDFVIKNSGTNLEVIVLSSGSPRQAEPGPLLRHRAD